MSDYKVEIRVKNARILHLMRLAGINTAVELSRLSGVRYEAIGQIINLKNSPMSKTTGTWKPEVLKLADALNCMPDDMFSTHQRTSFLANNKRSIEMSEAEVELLMDSREQVLLPDDVVLAAERKGRVVALLNEMLTPRQADIIKRRFGLDGDGEKPLDEIASTYGISGQQIRNIEKQAIRKLQIKRKHLEEYL
jgi:RNA polymerase primary sigma factor